MEYLSYFLNDINRLSFKVRKTAQTEIASLVKLNLANRKSHITSTLVTKFCLQHLQETGSGINKFKIQMLILLAITLKMLFSNFILDT